MRRQTELHLPAAAAEGATLLSNLMTHVVHPVGNALATAVQVPRGGGGGWGASAMPTRPQQSLEDNFISLERPHLPIFWFYRIHIVSYFIIRHESQLCIVWNARGKMNKALSGIVFLFGDFKVGSHYRCFLRYYLRLGWFFPKPRPET